MNREQDVIYLLGRLKDAGPEYPWQLRSQRRAAVLASLAMVPVAAGGLLAIPWIARLVKLIKAMGFLDKLILAIEVATITGLTGYGAATAYVYRYQIQALLFPSSGGTPFPTLSIPLTHTTAPDTATAGVRTPTPMGTATPIFTLPPLFTEPAVNGVPVNPPVIQGTPQPSQPTVRPPKPTRTHGLHLGQTKTPKPKKP